MQTTLQICTFLIILPFIHGYSVKTVHERNTTNEFQSKGKFYLSNNKLFQYKVHEDSLSFYSVDKENSINCSIAYEITLKNRRFPYKPSSIEKLKNDRVLIRYSDKIELVNTTSCTIDELIFKDCGIILPRNNSFDCIPYKLYHKFNNVTRYSYEGEHIKTFKLRRMRLIEIFKELEAPTQNSTYFVLENADNKKHTVKILNSTYGLELKFNLNISLLVSHSLGHDRFTHCTANLTDPRPLIKVIECTLVDFTSRPPVIRVAKMTPVWKTETISSYAGPVLEVQNLPAGGAVVFYGNRPVEIPTQNIFYRVIDANGEVGGEEVFYEYKKREDDDLASLYVYEAEDSVCGAIVEDESIFTKCIKVDLA